MKKTRIVPVVALLAASFFVGDRIAAQSRSNTTLRAGIEQRFDVLPLRDGVALRPHDTSRGVRSIEVTAGPIAVDGQVVSGAELREKLGSADADLVLSLSYLSDAERRALFGVSASPAGPPPSLPPSDAPAASAPVQPESPGITIQGRAGSRSDGDRIRIGGSITVAEGEVVEGDVVAVGGPVTVDGEVRGDVVAVGGGITLGPHASVADNVVVVGGRLSRDPAARVGGKVQSVDLGSISLGRWRWPSGPLQLGRRARTGGPGLALVRTLTRLTILCLLTAAVVLLGPAYVQRSGDRAAKETFKAGAIGLLAQVLFLPVLIITVVMLVVTIVGIPMLLLIPFVLLGLLVTGLVGFAGVAHQVGVPVAARLGWNTDNSYLTTVTGVVLIMSPIIAARLIGLVGLTPIALGVGIAATLFEYLVWTVGFGAVALVRFGKGTERPAAPAVAG